MDTETTAQPLPDSGALAALLHEAVAREASDVHLTPGYPVTYRVHGRLESEGDVLDPACVAGMVYTVMPQRLAQQLDRRKNFDFSIAIEHEEEGGEALAESTAQALRRIDALVEEWTDAACETA